MFMDRKTQYCQISVVPNFIYRFNTTPVKTLASYFVDIDRPLLKLIGVHTSFEWVCIWTRFHFHLSCYFLRQMSNSVKLVCFSVLGLFSYSLPPLPQAFFIKERSAYLNLKVKECYTQFLHFSRFFFPYFFHFLQSLGAV